MVISVTEGALHAHENHQDRHDLFSGDTGYDDCVKNSPTVPEGGYYIDIVVEGECFYVVIHQVTAAGEDIVAETSPKICPGTDGTNGQDGQDGKTPVITMDSSPAGDGCRQVYVSYEGSTDPPTVIGKVCDGARGVDGVDGTNGANGVDGQTGPSGASGSSTTNTVTTVIHEYREPPKCVSNRVAFLRIFGKKGQRITNLTAAVEGVGIKVVKIGKRSWRLKVDLRGLERGVYSVRVRARVNGRRAVRVQLYRTCYGNPKDGAKESLNRVRVIRF